MLPWYPSTLYPQASFTSLSPSLCLPWFFKAQPPLSLSVSESDSATERGGNQRRHCGVVSCRTGGTAWLGPALQPHRVTYLAPSLCVCSRQRTMYCTHPWTTDHEGRAWSQASWEKVHNNDPTLRVIGIRCPRSLLLQLWEVFYQGIWCRKCHHYCGKMTDLQCQRLAIASWFIWHDMRANPQMHPVASILLWHVSDGFGGQKFSKHSAHALLACYEDGYDLYPLGGLSVQCLAQIVLSFGCINSKAVLELWPILMNDEQKFSI